MINNFMIYIKKMKILGLILLMSIALGTISCYRPATPSLITASPSPTPELKTSLSSSKIPEEAEWQKVIKVAQKEGVVRIYESGGGQRRDALINGGFKEKYGIPVEVLSGRTNELVAKVLAERRAGIYQVDLFVVGISALLGILVPNGALDPIEPAFMLPELVDPELFKKTWRLPESVFIEPQHLFFSFAFVTPPTTTINTELVRGEEIKVLDDLLAPKWKGKISIQDPSTDGTGGTWFGAVMETKKDGEAFMKALARQEPFITRDERLQLQWLALGKQTIAIAASSGVVPEFLKAGAPIKYHPILEAAHITSGSANIALINRAPHPNAAKLFINWLLSKKGQEIYSQASWRPSMRLDVSIEGIDPVLIPKPGVKYFNAADPEFRMKTAKYFELAREIFGTLLK